MKFLSSIIFLIVVASVVPALAAPKLAYATKNGLAFTNEDNNQAPPGNYFALVCASKACKLQPAGLKNEDTTVEVYANGSQYGYIQRANVGNALAFVRGIPSLKEGPVKTWYFNPIFPDEQSESPAKWSKTIDTEGTKLRVTGHRANNGIPGCQNCKEWSGVVWKMTMGQTMRTLAYITDDPVQGPDVQFDVEKLILWVGDLDNDGKPDLLLRPQARSGGVILQLFLSHTLQVGKPWRPSAEFAYWPLDDPGC